MEKMVTRVAQVGMIVRDLDKAVEGFKRDFGLTEWDVFNANECFGELIVNDKPGKLNIRGAITNELGGFEIELLEPIGEGPYADWLAEHGPGVHHVAFIMRNKNEDFESVIKRELEAGRKPWIRAQMVDGKPGEKMDFAYIDRRADLGAILEIYNEDKE